MTWTKLSDDFADECWTLTDPAFRLLVEMLNYSNKKLLDCVIPKDEFRRFAKRPEALKELLDGGWAIDLGEHIEVIFHAQWQRTREQQLGIEDRNKKNGAKGGRPRKPKTEPPPDGNPSGNPDGNPTGLVWSGLANYATSDSESEDAETIAWPVAEIPETTSCSVCGAPLLAPVSQARGVCGKRDEAHLRVAA